MKKNIDIKKAIQQIPVKELREFVEVQTGKNQKFQAAFLKHFEDFFVEKESGDAIITTPTSSIGTVRCSDGISLVLMTI